MMLGMFAGCASDAPASSRFSVADSAGIEIVTSSVPQWEADGGWRIADAPSLRIGVVEGDERLQFQRVRDVAFADDGSIVMTNGGSSDIRVFDATGAPLAVMGRQGGGPGEFHLLTQLFLAGDTIIAHDVVAQRLTLFDRAGNLLATVPVSANAERPLNAVGRFADGTYLMKGEIRAPFDGELGLKRQRETLHHVAADGTLIADVGEFPGLELTTTRTPTGQVITGGGMYARRLAHAVHDSVIFIGTQDDATVSLLARDGTQRRIIRFPAADLSIGPADQQFIRAALEESAASAPDPGAFVDQMLEMWPAPERKPAYSDLHVDPDGNLWVGAPANTILSEFPSSWSVYDRDGRLLGSVAAPAGLRVLEVGRDAIAGVWRDEDDVEYIHVYPIIKN
ncbi:MAG TPA: 6-bladed beta-propeller [Longimicrobiales bacterium]|nr:6-bladed beta-propeller [Longimicrobiales bacterium]